MAKYNEIVMMKAINDYIKHEHPMYFKEFGVGRKIQNVEFISLVNAIYHVLKSTSPNGNVIIDGKIYQKIDKLFNNYVDSIFSIEERKEIDDKFGSYCDYVKTVIKEVGNLEDEQYLDKISWYVAGLVIQNFDYKKRPFFTSKNIIIDCYNIMDKGIGNYQKIDDIISSSVEASKKKIGFDKKTLDKMYCDIAIEMYKRGIEGENVNNFVIENFIKKAKEKEDEVKNKVRLVIREMDDPFTILDHKVIFEISFEATMSGEICAVDLIDGKLDDHIKEIAEKYRLEKIPEYKVVGHVYKVLKSEADKDITDKELREYAQKVVDTLRNANGFNSRSVIDGKYDDIVKKMYLDKFHARYIFPEQTMREQSVKRDKTENYKPIDYAKRNRVIKKIQQELAKFLIAAVIGSALGVAASAHINRREDNEAIVVVQSIDQTDYSINRSNSKSQSISYEKIMNGIIDYYRELKSYGDSYTYLSFYNAYSSGLDITDMDIVLSRIRNSSSQNEDLSGLNKMVNKVGCYYEYIYSFLLENGCVELLDEKYMSAIISYKQSFYGNSYGIPSDFHLHQNDKSNLEYMIQLYEEYSRKLQIELGDKIKNIETASLTNAEVRRGL